MKRITELTLFVILATVFVPIILPTSLEVSEGLANKTTICHRTNSIQNPYRKITVSNSSLNSGHKQHDDPLWTTSSVQGGARWGDIIPDATEGGDNTTDVNFSEAGKNIWKGLTINPNNGSLVCKVMSLKAFYDSEIAAGKTAAQIVAEIKDAQADEDLALLRTIGLTFNTLTTDNLSSALDASQAIVITTLAPTSVGVSSATLNGRVKTDNTALTCQFEYATNANFLESTLNPSPATSVTLNTTTTRTLSLTGLVTSTKYFYRLICYDSVNNATPGEAVSFTTGTTYTVTYDSNTATSGEVPTDFTLYSSSESAFVRGNSGTLVKTGFTFGGWTENSNGTGTVYSPSNTTSIAMTQNRTLYAKWTATTFPVIFDSNTATSGTMSNQTYTAGTAQSLTSNGFSKTGFTFDGWATSSGGSVVYSNSQSVTLYETTTVYAKWSAGTYAVTFDSNTATSGTMSDQSFTAGTPFNLTTVGFSKTGYTFAGWATTSGGSVLYTNTQSVTLNGATNLYAKWTANTNNAITWDDQTPTTASSGGSSTYTTDSPVTTIPTTPPTKSGNTFGGWWTGVNGSGTQLTNGSYTPTSPYGSVTFYAKWTVGTFYAITYVDNVAAVAISVPTDSSNYSSGASATISATEPSRTGYAFGGWHDNSDNTGTTYRTGTANNTYTIASSNVTLYAKWIADTNAITWDDQTPTTASSGGSSSYTTDSPVVTIPTTEPTKTGYTFGGWWTGTNGSGTQLTNGSYTPPSPYGAKTFYAKWTANSLTVTYDSQGGSLIANGSTTTGASIASSPGTPTRSGYSFNGWFVASSGGSAITFPYAHGRTANFTLYAQWTADAAPGNSKLNQSITLADGTLTNGQTVTLAATGYLGTGTVTYEMISGDCTLSGNRLTANSGNGSCRVRATIAEDSTYNNASTTASFSMISLLNQTITFNAPSNMRTTDASQSLNFSASSGLAVTLTNNTPTICRISGNSVVPLSPGTCSITASQGGNASYSPATNVTRTFNVEGLAQTLSFTQPANMKDIDDPQNLSGSASSNLSVNFQSNSPSICTVNASRVTPVAVGTCSITASQPGNATYSAAPSITRTLNVTTAPKLPQNPELVPATAMLTNEPPQKLWTTSNSNTPTRITVGPSSVCTIDARNNLIPAGAGTCSITVSQEGTRQYNPGQSTSTLLIVRPTASLSRLVDLTWSSPSQIVEGTPLTSIQLNARASVPGRYVYSPAAGAVLPRGIQRLNVRFIPDDQSNYLEANTSVSIRVVSNPTPSPTPTTSPTPESTTPSNTYKGTLENGNLAYADSSFNKGESCIYLPGYEKGYDAWHFVLTTRGAQFMQDPGNPAISINLNFIFMRTDGSTYLINRGAWVQTGKGAYVYTLTADKDRMVQSGSYATILNSDSGMRLSHTCPGEGSPSVIPLATPTPTPTASSSPSPTSSPTVSPSPTPTSTRTPTPAASPTPTPSPTSTASPRPTVSPSPTVSTSPTPSPSPTRTTGPARPSPSPSASTLTPAGPYRGTLENGSLAFADSSFNKGESCIYLPGYERGYDAWHFVLTTRGAEFKQSPSDPRIAIDLNYVFIRPDLTTFTLTTGAWVQFGKGSYVYTLTSERVRLIQGSSYATINISDSGMRLSHTCPGEGTQSSGPSPASTPTSSPSVSPSSSPSVTASPTASPTASILATPGPTSTSSPRPSASPTQTSSPTTSPSPTRAPSPTTAPTIAPSPTSTPSLTPVPTPTVVVPVVTPLPTPPATFNPQIANFVTPQKPVIFNFKNITGNANTPIVIVQEPENSEVTNNGDGTLTIIFEKYEQDKFFASSLVFVYKDTAGELQEAQHEFVVKQEGDVPSLIQTGYTPKNAGGLIDWVMALLFGALGVITFQTGRRGRISK